MMAIIQLVAGDHKVRLQLLFSAAGIVFAKVIGF